MAVLSMNPSLSVTTSCVSVGKIGRSVFGKTWQKPSSSMPPLGALCGSLQGERLRMNKSTAQGHLVSDAWTGAIRMDVEFYDNAQV